MADARRSPAGLERGAMIQGVTMKEMQSGGDMMSTATNPIIQPGALQSPPQAQSKSVWGGSTMKR